MFLLILNDMRCAKFEEGKSLCWSDDKEEIQRFLDEEKVETYKEPKYEGAEEWPFWGKTFRKGGPLEWFNEPWESDMLGIVDTGDESKWAEEATFYGDLDVVGSAAYKNFRHRMPTVDDFKTQEAS